MTEVGDAARTRLAIRIAYLIAIVWAISFIVDIIDSSYQPSPGIHALMLLVSGGLFGEGFFKKNNKKDAATSTSEIET
jgi:hypothetical protein